MYYESTVRRLGYLTLIGQLVLVKEDTEFKPTTHITDRPIYIYIYIYIHNHIILFFRLSLKFVCHIS